MLRLILGLLAIGAIELILDIGGFVISGIGEILKFCLGFGFILAILAALDGNFLPIILVVGLPIAGIILIIYYAKRRINHKNCANKKEKVVLDDSDFVEVVDSF